MIGLDSTGHRRATLTRLQGLRSRPSARATDCFEKTASAAFFAPAMLGDEHGAHGALIKKGGVRSEARRELYLSDSDFQAKVVLLRT